VRLLVLATAAAALLPAHGVVVPGRSLGGLRIGDPAARVQTLWGGAFGVCRGCERRTWYYNYVRFSPKGAAVEFRRGRVVALYTLWSPAGWHTPQGLRIGDAAARVTTVYGPLTRRGCGRYYVLLLPRRKAVTDFYVYNERLWGFGLRSGSVPACRT
jgi:hypothetical protein